MPSASAPGTAAGDGLTVKGTAGWGSDGKEAAWMVTCGCASDASPLPRRRKVANARFAGRFGVDGSLDARGVGAMACEALAIGSSIGD
jgi:hypothetical protein